MRSRTAWTALYVVLLGGGSIYLAMCRGFNLHSTAEIVLGCAGLLLGFVRPVSRNVVRLSARLDALPPRRHLLLIGVLAVSLAVHFLVAAWRGHRPLVPLIHDEQMYLLQARQFASGHLAMPALPLGEFFDTFYVFVKPVYASMYFPGTALAYIPSLWLHLPFFAWPIFIMTALCVMTYLVAARILGRLLAMIAVLAMLAVESMNWLPTATMSHPLGGLLGMTVLYAWLRWRAAPRIGWAMLLGAAAGWMAITRPLESLAFCLPVLIAILWTIRPENLFRTLAHAAIALGCAAPFLSLQLATNRVVTGRWLQLPIALYVQQEFPGMNAMGKAPIDLKTTSSLPQKRAMLRSFITPTLRRQASQSQLAGFVSRSKMIFATALASPLFILPLLLSLPMLRRVEIRVLWAIVISFCGAYALYGSYLPQYSSQIMAVLAMLALSGIVELAARYPSRADSFRAAGVLSIGGITIVLLLIMPNNATGDLSTLAAGAIDWRPVIFNYESLPALVKKPALVMIRYGEKSSPHVEPVYNLEAAWPDDCSIIRAHDFGSVRNQQLYRYYAAFQPGRNVYLFDRDTLALRPIGAVADLASAVPATQR